MTRKEEDVSHDDLRSVLTRIDRDTTVPPIDPAREAALMAAFDAASDSPHLLVWRSRWLAAAAMLAIVGGVAALFVVSRESPREEVASTLPPPSSGAEGEFVIWPGASALPPIENGRLVRMDLPLTMLPSGGVLQLSAGTNVVQADVLIAQDGFARAFRVVSVSNHEVQP